MAKYREALKLIKNTNLALTDEDLLLEMGPPPKKSNDNDCSFLDLGMHAKNLAKKMADKSKRESLYISKPAQEDCALEKENGRLGVKFDTFYVWLSKLAKENNIATDRERIKKVLSRREYDALRITDNFYNSAIRSFASQILRG